MRIGIVAPPWIPVPPPGYGGIESVIDTLARGLVRAGHEVLLAAPQESTCPVPKVPGTGSAKGATMGNTLDEMDHVIRAYAAMAGTDIIHDHTLAGPVYRHKPAGVPVVTTVHSPFGAKVRSLCRALAADVAIVAISDHQAGTAGDIPIGAVIHHGLAMEGIPVGRGDGGYACFLGRMHPYKGVAQAIEIARAGEVPLRIAAKMQNQQEHEYFNTQVRPRLSSNEEFLGEVGGMEKYQLLGGALALINPIQWAEPFGMVMIESLAAGTPVLATTNGSAPKLSKTRLPAFSGPRLRGWPAPCRTANGWTARRAAGPRRRISVPIEWSPPILPSTPESALALRRRQSLQQLRNPSMRGRSPTDKWEWPVPPLFLTTTAPNPPDDEPRFGPHPCGLVHLSPGPGCAVKKRRRRGVADRRFSPAIPGIFKRR
ncbi:glycosyltransferase [Pseudarthrobacter cellobiosi]|uniref:glycosyltransferase n=1 Tax=Pseudarthrobacter cellobiosi TaxID=2953654 RepID=UPI0027E3701A|nr:glycosyltransferase [Pseudarthrobacter sp. HLT3-5]